MEYAALPCTQPCACLCHGQVSDWRPHRLGWCRVAPGTLITSHRDMSDAVMTSIVLKSNVTLVDICSTRMLGQYGFLAKVFTVFQKLKLSVDVVATSEVSVSLTLDQAK